MIKKITLAFIISCVVISCGKKGDPEYKDSKKKTETKIMLIAKA